MQKITLVVTRYVIAQVAKIGISQKQIAVRRPSPALRIESATAQNPVPVKICGTIELLVGDNGAIWACHQTLGKQANDFADLYNLLERRPDDEITFQW